MSKQKKRTTPSMINVGGKKITRRTAVAQAVIAVPPKVLAHVQADDIQTKKGPVFQAATVAGIMAAKRTSSLIPLCHPIGLEDCQIDIRISRDGTIVIECRAEARHKTGVEMEALTGASVAALTVYDMCKSISQGIIIREVKLLEKKGGKSDYKA